MSKITKFPLYKENKNLKTMVNTNLHRLIKMCYFTLIYAGMLIYFIYGIRNSFGSNVLYQLVPEEERILLPSSPTYHVTEPQPLDQSEATYYPDASTSSTSSHISDFMSTQLNSVDTVLIE